MEQKIIRYWALLAFALVLCMGTAMAATFITPTTGGTITGGAYVFNVTSNLTGLTNCSVTGSSALTSDTLGTTWLINSTEGGDWSNATVNTTNLEDASDWTFTGTCFNTTANQSITTITGVIVDNTAPTAPTVSTTTASDKRGISITATVVAAETTACTMSLTSSFHQTGTLTMTHTGSSCTYTNLNLPGGGDFTLSVTATDGLNSTTTQTSYKVDEKKGSIVPVQVQIIKEQQDANKKENSQKVILILVAIAAYGYYAGWFGKKR